MAALLLRLAVALCAFRGVAAPVDNHSVFGAEVGWTARSIVLGDGFSSPFLTKTGPTALVPPLFPYLVAGIERIFGLYTAASSLTVLSLNSLLSALTILPIFFISRRLTSDRAGRVAVLIWTLYPYSIYFAATRIWDYALTALLLSLCVWMSTSLHQRTEKAWLGFGALCGLAALSNPSVLSVLAVMTVYELIRMQRTRGNWRRCGTVALLAGLTVCAPWVIRNARVFHQPIFIRDGFWLEFWAGNNGDTFESNTEWTHPASNPVELRLYQAVPEPQYMAQKRALSLGFVTQRPLFFVGVSARRVLCFWTAFWSADRRYLAKEPTEIPDVFFCTVITLLMWRGARRWWRRDRMGALPYLLSVAVFPLAYYVTHTSPDYRQPIEPLVVTLVAAGFPGLREMGGAGQRRGQEQPQELHQEQPV